MSKKLDRQVGILFLILLIMAILFFGTVYYQQKMKYGPYTFDYNGYDVVFLDEGNGPLYKVKIFLKGVNTPSYINLRTDPRVFDRIDIDIDKLDLLKKKELFITMHPTEPSVLTVIAAVEISKITGNQYLFNIPTYGSVIQDVEGKNETVIRTCRDVSDDVGIIYLKDGDETKVYSEDGCVIVQGQTEDELIEAANKLGLYLLGIAK